MLCDGVIADCLSKLESAETLASRSPEVGPSAEDSHSRKLAEVQLSSVGLPTGQLTAIAPASMAKFDAELRAVSAGSGHRCELVLARTRVEWSISGSLAGAESERSDVHRCRLPGAGTCCDDTSYFVVDWKRGRRW